MTKKTQFPKITWSVVINLHGLHSQLYRCILMTLYGEDHYYTDSTKDDIMQSTKELKRIDTRYLGSTWFKTSEDSVYMFFEDKKLASTILHCMKLYQTFIVRKL